MPSYYDRIVITGRLAWKAHRTLRTLPFRARFGFAAGGRGAAIGQTMWVEKILKTGVGFAGRHGVAGALWTRGETFFAEAKAKVFTAHSPAEDIETIRVEAREGDAAITLLEAKIKEKFGDVKWLHWQDAAENAGTPGS